MSGNGHSGDVFELPGEPIMEAPIHHPTASKSGINLNGTFTLSFFCFRLFLSLCVC